MTRKEWIGEYWLHVEDYLNYKGQWVEKYFSLGKCLGNDEACEKAIMTIAREFTTNKLRDVYIVDGWGQLIYM